MKKEEFISAVSELAKTYHANEKVRYLLTQIELIAIIGPTGVGKTTIIDRLKFPEVLSDTTRDKRDGEKDSKNYHFRTDYDVILEEIRAGKYVQFLVSSSGEFYGTRIDSYPESGSCVMAIFASAIPLFRQLNFKKVLPIYIMPSSFSEWMRRVGSLRSGDVQERLDEARQSLSIALRDNEYNFILNDDIDMAVKDVLSVMGGLYVDEHRTQLARETAGVLLERLGSEEDDLLFSPSV